MRHCYGIVLGIFALLSACSVGPQDQRPRVSVTIGQVQKEDVPVFVQAVGKLSPELTVEVKAQISATLKEIYLSEGSQVLEGDRLFRFDSASYEAKLERAEANLLKDEANLVFAKKKLERYMTLVEKEYVTQLSIDEMRKEVDAYEAQIKADKAEVELAKIDLEDTIISSHIDGVMGVQHVDVHNSIEKGTLMTEIVQIGRLYVDFYLPEKFLVQLFSAVRENAALSMQVITQDGEMATGKLTFMAQGVDPVTGTIFLRGLVFNEQKMLQPGQYVNVRLKLRELPNATVLPLAAVQIGQQGHYIYILQSDQTVALQVVKPVYTFDKGIVIAEPLPEGTQVVTDGHMNLVPGAAVFVQGENEFHG